MGFGLLNMELGAKSNVKAKTNLLLEVIPTMFYSTAGMRCSEAFQRLLKYPSFFLLSLSLLILTRPIYGRSVLGAPCVSPHAQGRQEQAGTCPTCPCRGGARGPYGLSLNDARGTLQPTIRHVYSCSCQRRLPELPVNSIRSYLSSTETSQGRS